MLAISRPALTTAFVLILSVVPGGSLTTSSPVSSSSPDARAAQSENAAVAFCPTEQASSFPMTTRVNSWSSHSWGSSGGDASAGLWHFTLGARLPRDDPCGEVNEDEAMALPGEADEV